MPPAHSPSPSAAASSLEDVLAAQDWSDLARRLTRYAYIRLRKSSWHTAEEIAQQAIVHLLDPAYASWDRARHPELFDCLGHLVNGIVANHFRLLARRGAHVSLREDDSTHDDEQPEPEAGAQAGAAGPEEPPNAPPPRDAVVLTDARTPEVALTESGHTPREELALAALRARLAGDALCLALLDRMRTGATRPAADAEALGVTVAEVYVAKRRLLHHTRAVARALAAGGDS